MQRIGPNTVLHVAGRLRLADTSSAEADEAGALDSSSTKSSRDRASTCAHPSC